MFNIAYKYCEANKIHKRKRFSFHKSPHTDY